MKYICIDDVGFVEDKKGNGLKVGKIYELEEHPTCPDWYIRTYSNGKTACYYKNRFNKI